MKIEDGTKIKFRIEGRKLVGCGHLPIRIDEANPEIGKDLKKIQTRMAKLETPKRFILGDKVRFNNRMMEPVKVGKIVETIFHESDHGNLYWEYIIWVKKEQVSHRFHDWEYLMFTTIEHYKPAIKSKKKRKK